jgi:hypothetical protein
MMAVIMEMSIITLIIVGAALFIALILWCAVRGTNLKKK